MVSCARPTAKSPSSALRAQGQEAGRARSLRASTASTTQARFLEPMRTRPEYFTASCAPRRALLLNSRFRAQVQVPGRGLSSQESIPAARSQDFTLTRPEPTTATYL